MVIINQYKCDRCGKIYNSAGYIRIVQIQKESRINGDGEFHLCLGCSYYLDFWIKGKKIPEELEKQQKLIHNKN